MLNGSVWTHDNSSYNSLDLTEELFVIASFNSDSNENGLYMYREFEKEKV